MESKDGEIPDNTLLRRTAAAAKLKAAGYPVSAASLATMASRGDGPLFTRFGRIPLYRPSDLIEWAEGRLSPPRRSAAEREAAREAVA